MKKAEWFIRLLGFTATPLIAWLALPGKFSIWPLLLICLVPLFRFLSSARNAKRAFVRGLTSGILFYILQIYWIVPVLIKFGGLPWYLALPALLLLVFYMSLYLALFSSGFFLMEKGGRFSFFLIGVPSAWVGLDWLRSWLFSGFPWLDIGYGFWSIPGLLQAADLFGHFGFTFIIVLVNCLVHVFIGRKFSVVQRYSGLLAVILLAALLGGYSLNRWHKIDRIVAQAPSALIGIVQGNIEQGQKWSPAQRKRTVQNYIELTEGLTTEQSPALLLWPETALPFYPRDNQLLLPLANFVQHKGIHLLTGAPWYEIEQDRTKRVISYYNAALLMSPDGTFTSSYFKSHLVPYGEYVPLNRYLPFLSPLVEAAGNFTPGRVDQPLAAGDIKAGVLICFESIFPGIGRAWVNKGANVLVNLTNDAWYGKSSAPYQSWAMTVYRAVETRRSVVRSANTGISGLIDPLGRVRSESPLFVTWSKTVDVPLMNERTFFVQWGYLFAPACLGLAVLIALFGLIRARRNGKLLV
jgi:apolipoprotein N-acyltransferase